MWLGTVRLYATGRGRRGHSFREGSAVCDDRLVSQDGSQSGCCGPGIESLHGSTDPGDRRSVRFPSRQSLLLGAILVCVFLLYAPALERWVQGDDFSKYAWAIHYRFDLLEGENPFFRPLEHFVNAVNLSLVGPDGQSRAVIVAMNDGPAVLLYDRKDVMRARMALGDEQVSIDVWDAGGNQRAVLSSIGPTGVVGVSDGSTGGNATLTATPGVRLLTVSDDAGEPVVQVGFAEGEPVFSTGEGAD